MTCGRPRSRRWVPRRPTLPQRPRSCPAGSPNGRDHLGHLVVGKRVGVEADHALERLALVRADHGVRRLEPIHEVRSGQSGNRGIQPHLHMRARPAHRAVGGVHAHRAQAADARDAHHDLIRVARQSRSLRDEVADHVGPQRRDETAGLLLAHLEPTTHAVMRRPHHHVLRDQPARRPRLGVDVHVLVLERDRRDEVAPASQDARCLRPLDVLAAGEAHEVRADVEEAAQVGHGRQRDGAVHDDWHALGVGDRDDLLDGQIGVQVATQVEHRDGLRPDRLFDLVREGPVVETHLHELRARQPQRMVVVVAVAPEHHDLVRHAGRVREAVHAPRIEPRQGRRGGHSQARGRARRDVARFGARELYDHLTGRRLEVLDAREEAGRLHHGIHHVTRRARAADLGGVAARVDDAPPPELRRDAHWCLILLVAPRRDARCAE